LTEILREHQRTINRAVRELEREKNKLQQQEKKLVLDIKRTAKQGQMVIFSLTFKNSISLI
jgi:charged multivesicular body protein 2A